MAKFVDFPESNLTLEAPDQGEAQPDGSVLINGTKVYALRVFADDKQFISCWELSTDELLAIAQTRRVYLYVLGGGHPPVFIQGINPFNGPPGTFVPADKTSDDQPPAA